jgi:ribosomal protein S12 methylthiotransferase
MTLSGREIAKFRSTGSVALLQVIVDEVDADGAVARSKADAPEIDGIVRIDDGHKLKAGQFADVEILHADEHDLLGRVVG